MSGQWAAVGQVVSGESKNQFSGTGLPRSLSCLSGRQGTSGGGLDQRCQRSKRALPGHFVNLESSPTGTVAPRRSASFLLGKPPQMKQSRHFLCRPFLCPPPNLTLSGVGS